MKKWLILQNILNAGTVYEDQPVGYLPKFMTLNMPLNNNIKKVYYYHCAVTGHLDDKDVRKSRIKKLKWMLRGVYHLVNMPDNSIGYFAVNGLCMIVIRHRTR